MEMYPVFPMMSVNDSFSHAELDATLAQMQLSVSASDLHGSLTGYLCGGGKADAAHMLDALELESDDAHAGDRAHALLEQLYAACRRDLDDPDMGFEPLLPGDDQDLERRAEALVEWCRGFLGGFGLAGAAAFSHLSDDGAEILDDFGTIAASQLVGGNGDEDEKALTEVLEFVRVGTLLIHAEVLAPRPGGASRSLH